MGRRVLLWRRPRRERLAAAGPRGGVRLHLTRLPRRVRSQLRPRHRGRRPRHPPLRIQQRPAGLPGGNRHVASTGPLGRSPPPDRGRPDDRILQRRQFRRRARRRGPAASDPHSQRRACRTGRRRTRIAGVVRASPAQGACAARSLRSAKRPPAAASRTPDSSTRTSPSTSAPPTASSMEWSYMSTKRHSSRR